MKLNHHCLSINFIFNWNVKHCAFRILQFHKRRDFECRKPRNLPNVMKATLFFHISPCRMMKIWIPEHWAQTMKKARPAHRKHSSSLFRSYNFSPETWTNKKRANNLIIFIVHSSHCKFYTFNLLLGIHHVNLFRFISFFYLFALKYFHLFIISCIILLVFIVFTYVGCIR